MTSSRNYPTLTHVLYVDDILVFYRKTKRNLSSLMDLFQSYGNVSDQIINPNKCLLFSSSMTPYIMLEIESLLGFKVGNLSFSYLGVPIFEKLIWSPTIPPSKSFLAWRICHYRMSTNEHLRRRGFTFVSMCHLCGNFEGSSSHLFLQCAVTKKNGFGFNLKFMLLLTLGFHNKPTDFHSAFIQISVSITLAGMLSKGFLSYSMLEFSFLKSFDVDIHPPKPHLIKRVDCCPPLAGTIKCNEDGLAKGALGHARSGGIFSVLMASKTILLSLGAFSNIGKIDHSIILFPSHIFRKGNSCADSLANHGANFTSIASSTNSKPLSVDITVNPIDLDSKQGIDHPRAASRDPRSRASRSVTSSLWSPSPCATLTLSPLRGPVACCAWTQSSMSCDGTVLREGVEEVRMAWNMVLRGWKGVFTMMERMGKMGFRLDGEGWFSQELPALGCCFGAMESAVVVDLKVGMCEGEGENLNGVRVNEVSVGILSVVDWRYASVEDRLRLSYLNFVRGLLFDDIQPLIGRFEILGTLCCTICEVSRRAENQKEAGLRDP
ncbi:hypothetical protein GmHk_05G013013 [Glycine max]|nr:hypothetical protein GmHk_05G013013 [Glycine max]